MVGDLNRHTPFNEQTLLCFADLPPMLSMTELDSPLYMTILVVTTIMKTSIAH